MSDDEADPELVELMRQHLGLSRSSNPVPLPADTGVLKDAKYIADNAIDVSISSSGTKAAARSVWNIMKNRNYSTSTWSEHELHPKPQDEATVNFIFTMDLLNFSFWSEDGEEPFAVDYRGERWTGYWSLVACLQRALDEGQFSSAQNPNTSNAEATTAHKSSDDTPPPCSDSVLEHVFRSSTSTPIPLLSERISILRQFSALLHDPSSPFDPPTPLTVLTHAEHSAVRLVNLLTTNFPPCFSDTYDIYHSQTTSRPLRLHKRAQILAADLWACFSAVTDISTVEPLPPTAAPSTIDTDSANPAIDLSVPPPASSPPSQPAPHPAVFTDIHTLTSFADYRIPQFLQHLSILLYSPRVTHILRTHTPLPPGSDLEIEIRGCTVWAVHCLKEAMLRDVEYGEEARQAEREGRLSEVLIDFCLYDVCKEVEREAAERRKKQEERGTPNKDERADREGGDGRVEEAPEMLPHHRTRSIWY